MSLIKKVIPLFILTLVIPWQVQAETKWELQSNENNLTLSGSCDTDVHIELYESENFEAEPLYTAVAPCNEENFRHDDNLLKWGIPDGEYRLVVESNRNTIQKFLIKEPPVTTEEAVAREAREKGLSAEVGMSANQIFEKAQASFGEKLYSLETDLITMQESLKDTTYPDFIKIGLGGALGVVESATKKLADAFFLVEQRDFIEKVTPSENGAEVLSEEVIPTDTSEETLSDEPLNVETPAVTEDMVVEEENATP